MNGGKFVGILGGRELYMFGGGWEKCGGRDMFCGGICDWEVYCLCWVWVWVKSCKGLVGVCFWCGWLIGDGLVFEDGFIV